MMEAKKELSSLRKTLDLLLKEGEAINITAEADPVYEIPGLAKTCDNGPALIFNNIKGYPRVRAAANMYSRGERLARLFGAADYKGLKFKCWDALKKPIPPKEVKEAPCQEVVITKDIDLMNTIPVYKYTKADGARVLGGGVACFTGKWAWGGSDIAFKRMHFRGKDWSTMLNRGGIAGKILNEYKNQKVPLTVNIGAPPPVAIVAAGGMVHTIMPEGTDKIGIAGYLQDAPIEVVKAKTQDALAIANAEWVLEGYIDTGETVWETDEAEKSGIPNKEPFFPEWPGYLGRAMQVRKFHVTAITHRKNPIFVSHLAHSIEHDLMLAVVKQATYLEMAHRLHPGLVVDVNILPAVGVESMVVFQIRKRSLADEGLQKNILNGYMGICLTGRLAVAVDEDVDIYSADDVLWAVTSRVNSATGITIGGDMRRMTLQPIEKLSPVGKLMEDITTTPGAIGLDATVPFGARSLLERAHYAVDTINLDKWLTPEQIASIKAGQCEYARSLAKSGH
jgi:gallate decarboxylase subunit C